MGIKVVTPWEFILASTALCWLITLALMSINLLDGEVQLAESASAGPWTHRLVSIDVLRWEAISTSLARLKLITCLLMQLKFSDWIDNLAESTSTGLFTTSCLVVKYLVGGEGASTESAADGTLVLVAGLLVAVKVDQGLLNFAEATGLRAAVTTVRSCILSLNSDQAYGTVVVGQLILRRLDVYVDEVEWPTR